MDYIPRIVDQEIADLVADVPAVLVVGPKAIGKTVSARRVAASVIDLSDTDQRAIVMARRAATLAEAQSPLLIDEWQFDPGTWEAMRRAVDADPSPGRFLLTGSANPRGVRVHSGAGRVARLRMRPLSMAERRPGEATVSLAGLWNASAAIVGTTSVGVTDYVDEILSSGFPAIRFGAARSRPRLIASYLDNALEHDVPELGFVPRRPSSLAQWLRAYAAATSTTASYSAIADAIPSDERASRATFDAYRDVLTSLWLLDDVPAFTISRNRLAEAGKMPKHQLADPALAATALGVTKASLLDATAAAEYRALRDGPLLGTLFESLATLSLRVYAQALGLTVSHLRTARGDHEVDLLVHGPDGRALAFEVKLTAAPDDGDVRHLHWLAQAMGSDLVDRVVLTTGERAYRRADGVAIVPLALLGP
ncbi:MAG: ATP-binding protein [Micrococcales bacterium]|nr:ATP-binding protein [Micrococcales bacterium]